MKNSATMTPSQTDLIKQFLSGKVLTNPQELMKQCSAELSPTPVYYSVFKRAFEKAGGVWESIKTTKEESLTETSIVLSEKGTPYAVWNNPIQPIENVEVGHRAIIAEIEGSVEGVIQQIHRKGDKFWPNSDGYTVLVNDIKRYVTPEQVKVVFVRKSLVKG